MRRSAADDPKATLVGGSYVAVAGDARRASAGRAIRNDVVCSPKNTTCMKNVSLVIFHRRFRTWRSSIPR